MSKSGSTGSVDCNTIKSTEKNIRIAPSIHWCFTLNNYESKDIDEITSNGSIKKYIFQEETGEKGTKHLQGYIEFKSKVRPSSVIKNKNYHWEKTRDIKKSIEYCSKEETRTGKIYTNIKIEKPLRLITKLYKWQQKIIDEIKEDANDRNIIVYVDKEGNKGKTQLCKLLCAKHDALCVSGKSNDIKYAIVKYKELNGIYPTIILLDIPRTNIDYINYEAIEKVKDGLFFCGKYESCQVIMNSPHVYLFMNEEPDTHAMTADRWIIRKL